jgi:hypothetical protein
MIRSSGKVMPDRQHSSKSPEVSRLIEPALVIGLITALIYLTFYRIHSILSSRILLPSEGISLVDLLWVGYRLANIILFIALGVIAIECALIFRKKYEYTKNPWLGVWLVLMVLAGFLYVFSKTRVLIALGHDAIFPFIAILSTVLVTLIALGYYTPPRSRWVRKWRQIIKLCGIVAILLFLYYYPVFIANDNLHQIIAGESGNKIILTPINNSTSLIPSVLDNKFFLMSYQDNKYYVREMHSSSPGYTKYFIIPDTQVKYAQIEHFSLLFCLPAC